MSRHAIDLHHPQVFAPGPVSGSPRTSGYPSLLMALALALVPQAIAAQPVPGAAEAAPADTALVLLHDPAAAVLAQRPWGVTVAPALGTGAGPDDFASYYTGRLVLRGAYRPLDALILRAAGGLLWFADSRPGSGSNFAGLTLSAQHTRLFREAFTGIELSGEVSWSLGAGLGIFRHEPEWPGAAATLRLSRGFGPVGLTYGLWLNTPFPKDDGVSDSCVPELGSDDRCRTNATGPLWQLMNGLLATYSPWRKLTLAASFGLVHSASAVNPLWASGFPAEAPAVVVDSDFCFQLSALYRITDRFVAGLRLQNGGPWRISGLGITGVFYDPRLAQLQAAAAFTF